MTAYLDFKLSVVINKSFRSVVHTQEIKCVPFGVLFLRLECEKRHQHVFDVLQKFQCTDSQICLRVLDLLRAILGADGSLNLEVIMYE